jgi:molybdate transport system substrate-binding protein
MSEIKVLALQSPQIIINSLAEDFERRSGYRIKQLLHPADLPLHIRQKINAGVSFDAAFVAPFVMDELLREDRVISDSRTKFLRVPIGVAVRAGAVRPDIGSVDAFKNAMMNAKSIAYLKAGMSGPYLDGLFERFGISDEIRTKARRTETDTVGELVAAGEVEIGVTAIATLMATTGLDIVGPIPPEIQSYVDFEAAVSTTASVPSIAKELIEFVTGPTAIPVIRSKGMEPWLA